MKNAAITNIIKCQHFIFEIIITIAVEGERALSMGAIGVITMSGAPESHLGILSREFQTPCVMTAHLTSSESRYVVGATGEEHFEEIARELDGKHVRLDCTDHEVGRVVEA